MNCRHIIWDWNGTLLDDVQAAVNALNRMLVKRGAAETTLEYYRAHFRFPVRPFYEELGVDLNEWDWDEICTDFHKFIAEEAQQVRKESPAALQMAAQAGFRQSVLSALRQDLLEKALTEAGFMPYLTHAFGVDNLDGASKLQRGRELMAAIGSERVVFVGDTLHDAEVARELGGDCVLVACGHQERTRLAAAEFPVVNSPIEAIGFLMAK